jgi:fructuronate reductase
LRAPQTHLVTITVSEKGYTLTPAGDLDIDHPTVRHDLARAGDPQGLIGWLVEGLALRRSAGLAPFTVMSCDNMADNCSRLRRGVIQFAQIVDRELAAWIADAGAFPRTMVDSITPPRDPDSTAAIAAAIGVQDSWPVRREAFAQWVVEDVFAGLRPPWADAGVTVTNDVGGFEQAKLRLLNGAHSALAYLGLLRGHESVADAMADQELAAFVQRLAREDIAPTVQVPRGLALTPYIESIFQRFRNPVIRYPLLQIAGDGSQKLPFRLLGTIEDAQARRRTIARLCTPVAAWLHFVQRQSTRGIALADPLGASLTALSAACTGDATADVARFVAGLPTVFSLTLRNSAHFLTALTAAYQRTEAGALPHG